MSGRIDINLLLETVLEGIQRGIGMDRTIFALLTKDRTMLREKVSLGWRKTSYTRVISLALIKNPINLFCEAMSHTEGYWLKPGQDDALYSYADIETVGKHPCFLMSICSGDKPIGLIYCDRAYKNQVLTEEEFRSFKHFVKQANIGLSLYRLQDR
ncbi:MAG: hypothetical protein Kow0065_11220 [Methylomicrobium sp.]